MSETEAQGTDAPRKVKVGREELLAILEAKCPSVPTLTEADFADYVLDRTNPRRVVIVNFFARTCGYCHECAGLLDELALAGYDIVKVEGISEAGKGVAERYSIHGYPTFVLFRGGQLASVYSSHRTFKEMAHWIRTFGG